LTVGNKYRITLPQYEEDLVPEPSNIAVIKKTGSGYIVLDLDHGFTYEIRFSHLMDYTIETINY
jgi:hypothetical protein